MNALKLAKFKKRATDILTRLDKSPELQKKLEECLRSNGFDDIADLALDAKNEFCKEK